MLACHFWKYNEYKFFVAESISPLDKQSIVRLVVSFQESMMKEVNAKWKENEVYIRLSLTLH